MCRSGRGAGEKADCRKVGDTGRTYEQAASLPRIGDVKLERCRRDVGATLDGSASVANHRRVAEPAKISASDRRM